MHLAIAILALAAAGAAPDAAPRAETIEIMATGIVTRPADVATFSINVQESGRSDAEALRLAQDRVRSLTGAARAAGVADTDIRASSIGLTSFAGMTPELREAYRNQAELRWYTRRTRRGRNGPTALAPQLNAEAGAGIIVRLRDLSRLDELRRAMTEAGDSELDWPDYALTDQRDADAAARRQALAMARSEAEAQASSRGMRVARIARVSERLGAQLADEWVRDHFFERHAGDDSLPGPEITIRRPIAVTFELVQR